MKNLVDKLYENKNLDREELYALLSNFSDVKEYLFKKADKVRKSVYGNNVFIRGLIEISNYCENDCFYCGIRKSNNKVCRYRLNKEEIYECAKKGYEIGFRTFVLQGGEDLYFDDDLLVEIISNLRKTYPDCAITISLGERSKESYLKLFEAGANRYLLRHESINKHHYSKLHPKNLTIDNRIRCLQDLKDIGFQTGAGMMIGSPFQTLENIVDDLLFLKKHNFEMVGIGPFISHKDTPFKDMPNGDVELTLVVLAIVRLLLPNVLLPSTTALNTINGRNMGIKVGCNVMMPNLSPNNVRDKYMLYDNKISSNLEAGENLKSLQNELNLIGYNIVIDRGDYKKSNY